MKIRNHSTVPAAATLLALLIGGAAAPVMAQAPAPPPGKMPEHNKMPQHKEGVKGMPGMSGMMGGPHHVLAMAYRDNLATFAHALGGQVTQSKTVNLELARPAVTEMRRSFDQMQQHHQAQKAMMADHMTPPMSEMMQRMETRLTALGEHLTALESEVGAATPDPTKVSGHISAILKECAGMSAMPGKAKPHRMP